MADCIGCGYCCRTAQCQLSLRLYGKLDRTCPELVFHDGRYWCRAVENAKGSLRGYLVQELAIGEGCCSPLNTDRKEIPKPEFEANPDVDWEKVFKELSRLIAVNWVSGDVIALIAMGLEDRFPGVGKLFAHIARDNRSFESFLG